MVQNFIFVSPKTRRRRARGIAGILELHRGPGQGVLQHAGVADAGPGPGVRVPEGVGGPEKRKRPRQAR